MTDLGRLLAEHEAEAFPTGVVKGIDYGKVDPVMIGADIVGWARRVADGRGLTAPERDQLQAARDDLEQSLPAFAEEARPYYEKLLAIASTALA